MERGSDKHGPRQDDALAEEVAGVVHAGRSSHAEEWREEEPSGEDQPDVDRAPGTELHGGTPEGMTEADVAVRSELAQVLGRAVFPADAATLERHAAEQGAREQIVALLRDLPAGRSYGTVAEVWEAAGGGSETRRS